MDYRELFKLANQAYLDVLRAHRKGWCPPSAEQGDKRWSKTLRENWPEFATVDVRVTGTDRPNYSEMRRWCDNQDTDYWVNGGQNRWYFERRDIAALFKLTFGGAQ